MSASNGSTLSGQKTARVNIDETGWLEFRMLAIKRRRSIADYLGELVRREVHRQARRARVQAPNDKSAESDTSRPRTRLADQKLLTRLPGQPSLPAMEPPSTAGVSTPVAEESSNDR